jgi:hypothetical protein
MSSPNLNEFSRTSKESLLAAQTPLVSELSLLESAWLQDGYFSAVSSLGTSPHGILFQSRAVAGFLKDLEVVKMRPPRLSE